MSWRTLYGSEPLLPDRYDPQNATGYVCVCPPGTTGALIEPTEIEHNSNVEDIEDISSPLARYKAAIFFFFFIFTTNSLSEGN